MAEKLEILITADDRASRVMKGLGNIAGGVLKVGMLGAAAGVAALASGLGLAIKEAMEAQTVQAQLNAVLKSTGGVAGVTADMANKLADSLTGVTRFSDEAILSGENMLLTFTNIGADVFPMATETILNMSTALGQDLQSSAVQLGKALQDPVLGVTALRRVGVNFNETQVEMIKGMVETGDLMGAQKFILAELATEFGGAAKAAGATFAGQLDILKNSLLNVAEGVGMSLLPILQRLMTDVIQPLLPRIQEFARLFSELVTVVFDKGLTSPEAWTALANIFGADLATKIQNIATWLQKLASTVGTFITNQLIPFVKAHLPELKAALIAIGAILAAAAIVSGIMSIVGVITALLNPLGLVIAIVALLGAAWAGNWFDIRGKTQAVIDFIRPYIETFLRNIQEWWRLHGAQVIATVKALWEGINLVVGTVITFIKNTISAALNLIHSWCAQNGDK